jgi:hypothetical protein
MASKVEVHFRLISLVSKMNLRKAQLKKISLPGFGCGFGFGLLFVC